MSKQIFEISPQPKENIEGFQKVPQKRYFFSNNHSRTVS
jgi:hypothetical protein